MSLWDQLYTNLIAADRWKLLLEGLCNTMIIALGAIFVGTMIGAVLSLMRISKNKFLNGIAFLYITVVRGIPVVTQLMIFYFVIFAPVNIPKLAVAIIGFGVNSGAYVAEIFRGGIQSVPHGQIEAGRSLGLGKWQTMRYIIFPQAVKAALPTYTNEFVVLIKETSIAGYVAMRDLTKAADQIRNATFNAWIPLFSVAVIYLVLTLGFSQIFAALERRLARSDRG